MSFKKKAEEYGVIQEVFLTLCRYVVDRERRTVTMSFSKIRDS